MYTVFLFAHYRQHEAKCSRARAFGMFDEAINDEDMEIAIVIDDDGYIVNYWTRHAADKTPVEPTLRGI